LFEYSIHYFQLTWTYISSSIKSVYKVNPIMFANNGSLDNWKLRICMPTANDPQLKGQHSCTSAGMNNA